MTEKNNVVNLHDKQTVSITDYQLTRQDTLTFLRVLEYIQSKSLNEKKAKIEIDIDKLKIVTHHLNLDRQLSDDTDRKITYSSECTVDLYLPSLNFIMSDVDCNINKDEMIDQTMLAIESLGADNL